MPASCCLLLLRSAGDSWLSRSILMLGKARVARSSPRSEPCPAAAPLACRSPSAAVPHLLSHTLHAFFLLPPPSFCAEQLSEAGLTPPNQRTPTRSGNAPSTSRNVARHRFACSSTRTESLACSCHAESLRCCCRPVRRCRLTERQSLISVQADCSLMPAPMRAWMLVQTVSHARI